MRKSWKEAILILLGVILSVSGAVAARTALWPRLPGMGAEQVYVRQTTGDVYRFVVCGPAGLRATLYNALGQYQQAVLFDADGQAVVAVPAGDYILCAGDAEAMFSLESGASVRVTGGCAYADGSVLIFAAGQAAYVLI